MRLSSGLVERRVHENVDFTTEEQAEILLMIFCKVTSIGFWCFAFRFLGTTHVELYRVLSSSRKGGGSSGGLYRGLFAGASEFYKGFVRASYGCL